MPRTLLLTAGCLLFLGAVQAQVNGGRSAFAFLDLPVSARLTALGGQLVSVADDDIALAQANPALAGAAGHQQLSFNHTFHPAGTGSGMFAYGHHSERLGTTFHGGVRYFRYGEIPRTDLYANDLGKFSPTDLALNVGASRRWKERLSYGVNLRFVQSTLDAWSATALSTDAGIAYENPERRFTVGMALQNIGGPLRSYTDTERASLPFHAVVGISHRLKYLPFRLSVTAHTLERWNVRYDDPALRPVSLFQESEEGSPLSRGVDNVFRHLTFSGEFLLGKRENFRIRLAYDHRLRRELLVPGYGGLAGFSGGLGFKVYRFRLDYGFGVYHLAGTSHQLSISTSLKEFFSGVGG